MKVILNKDNLPNILIIIFLGIALITAIICSFESLATAIIGIFVGYMTNKLQNSITTNNARHNKNKDSDVK